MSIRKHGRRRAIALGLAGAFAAPSVVRGQLRWKPAKPITVYNPVSYTHLTLPTIRLV